MKRIVCDLCEGTEFIKEGGFFICQGCGTKYSLEEAKGMMKEVEGAAPVFTGTPVASVPIGNPNQQQIDNMLILASTAYEADNNKEAENYCNQVIALDAMNYKAWLLKGKAAGWQSTLQNQRITEAAHAFAQAIDFAPADEKEAVKEEAVDQLKRLGLACISLRKNHFSKYPDDEELAGFETDRQNLLSALMVLLSKGISASIPEGYEEEIAIIMNQAAVSAFEKIRSDYNNNKTPLADDWHKAVNETVNCIELIKRAIDASDVDEEEDITRYENIIIMNDFIINLTAFPNYSSVIRSLHLADDSKTTRLRWKKEWQDKVDTLKKNVADQKAAAARKAEEEKQARIKAYWEAHADEKAALDDEKKTLDEKKSKLNAEIIDIDAQIKAATPSGSVPSEEEANKLGAQIKDLENQRANLGLFSGKQKKQIGEELASLYGRRDTLKIKIEEEKKARQDETDVKLAPLKEKKADLQSQVEAVNKRINAIETELTKDPEV